MENLDRNARRSEGLRLALDEMRSLRLARGQAGGDHQERGSAIPLVACNTTDLTAPRETQSMNARWSEPRRRGTLAILWLECSNQARTGRPGVAQLKARQSLNWVSTSYDLCTVGACIGECTAVDFVPRAAPSLRQPATRHQHTAVGDDRPLVVELAGPAGTGKSTLAQRLVELDPGIRARPRVSLWRHLTSVPPLVPTFVSLHLPLRRVLGKEMKRVLRLRALHRLAEETRNCEILLFDEGPVYLLARILVFGGRNIQTRGFDRWWRRAIAAWADTLDAIVWLEAPEQVLAARLRTRSQHPFGNVEDQAVTALFRAYREAFTCVIAELTAAGGPAPWTVPTDRGSVDLTAPELLAGLRALRGTASRASASCDSLGRAL